MAGCMVSMLKYRSGVLQNREGVCLEDDRWTEHTSGEDITSAQTTNLCTIGETAGKAATRVRGGRLQANRHTDSQYGHANLPGRQRAT